MIIKILKVLVGLIGVFFVALGLQWIFVPGNLATEFAVSPVGIKGISTLRADIGSFFLCMGIFSLASLRDSIYSPALLCCTALLVGVAAFARLMGFILDGFTPDTLVAFVMEIVFVVLYVVLAYLIKNNSDTREPETGTMA